MRALLEVVRRFLVGVELGQVRRGRRIGIGLEHLPGPRITVLEQRVAVLAHRQRPTRVLEDPGFGFQRDVGIDQRCAAQATTDHHVLLGVDVQVEQPGARTDVTIRIMHLQLLGGGEQCVGILAGLDLPAPLQQTDRAPGPGQARRGDAAAVAGTNDDNVVVFLDFTDGGRDPCHVQVLSGRRGNSAVACKSTGAQTPGRYPAWVGAAVNGVGGKSSGVIGAHADWLRDDEHVEAARREASGCTSGLKRVTGWGPCYPSCVLPEPDMDKVALSLCPE